jgi:hypothetical protein
MHAPMPIAHANAAQGIPAYFAHSSSISTALPNLFRWDLCMIQCICVNMYQQRVANSGEAVLCHFLTKRSITALSAPWLANFEKEFFVFLH